LVVSLPTLMMHGHANIRLVYVYLFLLVLSVLV
jgi:hypothetical protein